MPTKPPSEFAKPRAIKRTKQPIPEPFRCQCKRQALEAIAGRGDLSKGQKDHFAGILSEVLSG